MNKKILQMNVSREECGKDHAEIKDGDRPIWSKPELNRLSIAEDTLNNPNINTDANIGS